MFKSGLILGVVALMAGLGALGGLLWRQLSGSKRTVTTPPNYGGTPPTE